jgi:hypothetical protein
MVKQIAQQLFDWIKEAGPTGGDAFDQERIDEVDSYLYGTGECPVSLSPEEDAVVLEHRDAVGAAIEELMGF